MFPVLFVCALVQAHDARRRTMHVSAEALRSLPPAVASAEAAALRHRPGDDVHVVRVLNQLDQLLFYLPEVRMYARPGAVPLPHRFT